MLRRLKGFDFNPAAASMPLDLAPLPAYTHEHDAQARSVFCSNYNIYNYSYYYSIFYAVFMIVIIAALVMLCCILLSRLNGIEALHCLRA